MIYLCGAISKMPRYYCDYCDMYLTHDSAGGRKEHIRGMKHRNNVIAHFKPKLRHFMCSGEGNTWQGWQNSMKGGQGPPPLPNGWRQNRHSLSKHESGRPYYVHLATNLATWIHPRLLKPDENPDNGGTPKNSWEETEASAAAEAKRLSNMPVNNGNADCYYCKEGRCTKPEHGNVNTKGAEDHAAMIAKRVCIDFHRGKCTRGDSCHFRHNSVPAKQGYTGAPRGNVRQPPPMQQHQQQQQQMRFVPPQQQQQQQQGLPMQQRRFVAPPQMQQQAMYPGQGPPPAMYPGQGPPPGQ